MTSSMLKLSDGAYKFYHQGHIQIIKFVFTRWNVSQLNHTLYLTARGLDYTLSAFCMIFPSSLPNLHSGLI